MNIVDIIIIIVLALFALIGFNNGLIKSLIVLLGFIIVITMSYLLKNIIGDFLVINLPFFSFGYFLKDVTALNVILYQALAFVILLVIFGLIYRFLVTLSGIFEKILRLTIVLGIPSKIGGIIIGFIEGYIVVYLALFVLTQPFLHMDILQESSFADKIVNHSPVISDFAEGSLRVFNEIKEITVTQDQSDMNKKIVELILDEKVTSKETMQKLVEQKKIVGDEIIELINNYQKR